MLKIETLIGIHLLYLEDIWISALASSNIWTTRLASTAAYTLGMELANQTRHWSVEMFPKREFW
jgi:hypothetical protein